MNYLVYALVVSALYINWTNMGTDNEQQALIKIQNSSGRLIKE
jgi:hypothetical protein